MDGCADKAGIKRHLAGLAENKGLSSKTNYVPSDFPLEPVQTNHNDLRASVLD